MATDTVPGVLIAEDESDLADLYAAWLSEDYDVRVAKGGKAALEQIDETIDVVLLDRRMPDLSGDEVLEEIRDRGFDCRVAMVSAVTPEHDIIEMGFDDYLVKPVRRDEFVELLDRLIWRSQHSEDVREFLALASKKAVLDAESSPSTLESSRSYTALERELREKFETIEATLEGLEDQDIEALVDDLRAEVPSDAGR
jgi:DNA-binding response OmpR family regulator